MNRIRRLLMSFKPRLSGQERQAVIDTAERVLGALRRLDNLLKTDRSESGTLSFENLLDSLKRNVSNVVLYGNYSTGKSTLINSLTRHDVRLPHSPSPTTAVQTRVIFGDVYAATIHFTERRLVGRFRDRKDFEIRPTLEAVWRMVSANNSAIRAVQKAAMVTGPWEDVGNSDIERWLNEMSVRGVVPDPTHKFPNYLKLEFVPREPITINLSNPKGQIEISEWVCDDARALAIERIDVTSPSPSLRQVLYIDTPGIDSLVEEHQDVAMRTLHAAHAVLFLYSIRSHPQVHNDDKMALATLARVIQDRPERLFIIGTLADLALSNYEEEPQYRPKRTVSLMQKDAVMGLEMENTLDDYVSLFPDKKVDPKQVFPIDCRNLDAALLDGQRLRKELDKFLQHAQGPRLLQTTARRMARQLGNRIVVLEQPLFQAARSSENEEGDRRLSTRIDRMQKLVDRPATEFNAHIQGEMDRTIGRQIGTMKEWVTNGFRNKKDVVELKGKWEKVKAHFVKTFEAQAQAALKRTEEEVNDVLEPKTNRFHLPELDLSGIHFGFAKIEESLSGFWYSVKSIFDFLLPTNLRKSNLDNARAKVHEELGRIEPMLKKECSDALATTHKDMQACIREIRDTMNAYKNKLDTLREDSAKREELINAVLAECDILRGAAKFLTRVGGKRASMQ